MIGISVISTIYKGKKYIQSIINMIEENALLLNKEQDTTVELILVNDYPKENLDICYSDKIKIHYIVNSKNMGIHASRVIGLNKSQGEYILFLDQDDKISNTFLVSQWKKILDADAIVCNGFFESGNSKRIIYENFDIHTRICQFKNYVYTNPIVSPGQVLIRKSSIPSVWKENILINNGADDLYLWLVMLGNKSFFNINQETLYIHKQTENNTSSNYTSMMMSRLEISFILEKLDLLDKGFITMNKEYLIYLLCKNNHHAILLDKWMKLLEDKKSFGELIEKNGYKNIAVYGMGILGRHLVKQLEESKIQIKYIIDKNSNLAHKNIPVIRPGELMNKVDAIIITPVGQFDEIKEELENYYSHDMISFEKLIDNFYEQY